MPKLITTSETKSLLKQFSISQAAFSERYGISHDAMKDILSGKTKLTKERQEDFIDTIKSLSGKKSIDDFDVMKIQRGLTEWAYSIIVKWIKTEELEALATYWNNLDDTYSAIDVQATQFLYRCCDITAPANKDDKRLELLEFMRGFSSSVAAVQKTMPTIKIFLDADESIKKRETDYKKSKVYKNKDKHDIIEQYRSKLEKKYEKLFFEIESNKAIIIYNQAGFITTMDKTDWDLLIAYTLVNADDENGEKIKQINDKLESLI